jgi:hypothetical protein
LTPRDNKHSEDRPQPLILVDAHRSSQSSRYSIGNIGELSGYLAMWESLKSGVTRGLLAITLVEHDELTTDANFPYLPTGNDGRAREGRAK